MISHHGVQFKEGKEDKYAYLMISIQILQAIDKDYDAHASYSYETKIKQFSNEEIHQILSSHAPTLIDDIEKARASYALKIEKEIENIQARTNIQEIEKHAWVNNLNFMKQYRIQRAVNKIYYMKSIALIREVIFKKGIKQIDTPFHEKYWHVLQTIQGSLEKGKRAKKTSLKIEHIDDKAMIAKLIINN